MENSNVGVGHRWLVFELHANLLFCRKTFIARFFYDFFLDCEWDFWSTFLPLHRNCFKLWKYLIKLWTLSLGRGKSWRWTRSAGNERIIEKERKGAFGESLGKLWRKVCLKVHLNFNKNNKISLQQIHETAVNKLSSNPFRNPPSVLHTNRKNTHNHRTTHTKRKHQKNRLRFRSMHWRRQRKRNEKKLNKSREYSSWWRIHG